MNESSGNSGNRGHEATGHPLLEFGRILSGRESKLLLLNKPEDAHLVLEGYADIFLVRLQDGRPKGSRQSLIRIEAGGLILGLGHIDHPGGYGLIAVGNPETRILALPRKELEIQGRNSLYQELIAGLLSAWLNNIARGMKPELPPRDAHFIPDHGGMELPQGETGRPATDAVFIRWTGDIRLAGREHLPIKGNTDFFPLPGRLWINAPAKTDLESISVAGYLENNATWTGLDRFHQAIAKALSFFLARHELLDQQRLAQKRQLDESLFKKAYQEIAGVLSPGRLSDQIGMAPGDQLLAACRLVGRELNIDFQKEPDKNVEGSLTEQTDTDQDLRDIARAARIRLRSVALRGDWWRQDNGPLLAFVQQGNKPVALLPDSSGSYVLVSPETGNSQKVGPKTAETLSPFAVTFYRSLPQRILAARELVKFGFLGCKKDFNIILTLVLVGGILGLVTPLATELIFSEVIPKANMSYLWQISIILFVCYLAGGALNMVRDFGVLRIAGKMAGSLEAAVWDRLLNLPAPFFKRYASGDLALRGMGINLIRQLISNVVVSNTLGGLSSSLNLLIMFYYSWKLALIGLGLVLVAVLVTVWATRAQLKFQRRMFDIQGRISALVLQLVNGVNKLRVAGAENRAFAQWAQKFSTQKMESLKAGKVSNIQQAINAGFPILSTAVIYAWLVFYNEGEMEMSEFLAFNTAFGIFLQAAMMMSTSVVALLNAVPIYERLRPIMEAQPESDPGKGKPGELSGRLQINKLNFRYQSDGPIILLGINLDIQPGEFVALVGPSGSGKSTLLRLLLGFETPEEGSIFYDQYDLNSVDPGEIRRQIGVVLQSAQLMTGTIFTNIMGSSNLSQEYAWEAARLAGFDKDIESMPMGMETMVSEGGGTLSGGQRQRLLIARALVKKPRIIYFDEATSALDNETQSVVSQSLNQLNATRLVIAHRLSTVINADRIVVLKEGQIIEQGTYKSLLAAGGEFAQLAKRQLA